MLHFIPKSVSHIFPSSSLCDPLLLRKFSALPVSFDEKHVIASYDDLCSTFSKLPTRLNFRRIDSRSQLDPSIRSALDKISPSKKELPSMKYLYRIINGPSSSHTGGPTAACNIVKKENPGVNHYRVHLFGSLADTGKGHFTDIAIVNTLAPASVTIEWHYKQDLEGKECGMLFEALSGPPTTSPEILSTTKFWSIGGGALEDKNGIIDETKGTKYKEMHLRDVHSILDECETSGRPLHELIFAADLPDLREHLHKVWAAMKDSIHRGLKETDVLPGTLRYPRRACNTYRRAMQMHPSTNATVKIMAYALAVSEENACGHVVCTAPTCGSCGVLPGLLYHMQEELKVSDDDIVDALATAGVFGNAAKTDATIAGSKAGCQAEVGVAVAMAAAAATFLLGGSARVIEKAAQSGLESMLGLSCDPVEGYVQIPCIERNALGATRAMSCSMLALAQTDPDHFVSYDATLLSMLVTGILMDESLKERSDGGLAQIVPQGKGLITEDRDKVYGLIKLLAKARLARNQDQRPIDISGYEDIVPEIE
ncbi:L-serine ammonia-lyase [Aduncisulcus paluster]|uniref:L-serine ammonia-lyase n=1 Tax=Aduncisulcus paluster TaxID=2918883 RepID=A0ABQ5K4L9_9EUKA|nr:L-serine ammonia-lyase [Aduncisulcus paluster]